MLEDGYDDILIKALEEYEKKIELMKKKNEEGNKKGNKRHKEEKKKT